MSDSRSRRRILEWARLPRVARPDVVAGLTAAAVVIPKAMAYATIAGLPVQVGLYTALVPMVVYALLGTSRSLSVSTTTTIAILVGAELAQVAPGRRCGDADHGHGDADPPRRRASSAGRVVLRLGFVANFISEPVLIGFKAGIGLVIVLDQLPKLLGVHIDKGGFFHNLLATVQRDSRTPRCRRCGRSGHDLCCSAMEHCLPACAGAADRGGRGIAAMSLLGPAGASASRPSATCRADSRRSLLPDLLARAALARRRWASR